MAEKRSNDGGEGKMLSADDSGLVEISSRDELEEWLQDKPREWAQVIAVRCALRALPLVFDPKQWPRGTPDLRLTLSCLRAMAVSSAAAKYPADDTGLAAATAAAAYAAAASAAYAADADAATATAAAAAAANAAYATAAAAYAAAYAHTATAAAATAEDGREDIWAAIRQDIAELSAGTSPVTLAGLPLWPRNPPDWWVYVWQRGAEWLKQADAGFELWIDWYECLIAGEDFAFEGLDEKTDPAFARFLFAQDDKWWDRDAAEVNRDLLEMVTKLGGEIRPPKFSGKKPAPPEPQANRQMRSQGDGPALIDRLGRQPFAEVLARRLRRTREELTKEKSTDQSFFLHIDGPWGSGKSSVINFIRDDLSGERSTNSWWMDFVLNFPVIPSDRNPDGSKKWITIDFNAWREQHNEPAWWALITQIVKQSKSQLGFWPKLKLRRQWWWWKWTSTPAKMIVIIAALVGLLAFLDPTDFLDLEDHQKIILGIASFATVIGGVWNRLRFGSGEGAKEIEKLHSDPYGPIMKLFGGLVQTIDRPILVIVDDLDRCSSTYVVSLLESIQTMLRDAPISYLVAGDKRWIITSFEKEYGDFCDTMDTPGRSTGHLFVEKLFQLSAPLPVISKPMIKMYWEELISSKQGGASQKELDDRRVEAAQKADSLTQGVTDQDRLEDIIEETEDATTKQALREKMAVQTATKEAEAEREHEYLNYVTLMEPNPRALKRLVNYIGVQQAVMILEGRRVESDLLARWCVLEMRWPEFAMELKDNRSWLAAPKTAPQCWQDLMQEDDIKSVFEGEVHNSKRVVPIDSKGLEKLFG